MFSQRQEEAAIVENVVAEDHAVLMKAVKKSMIVVFFPPIFYDGHNLKQSPCFPVILRCKYIKGQEIHCT